MQSSNGKVGQIPVSTTSPESCPDCALKGVCYAEGGPLAIFWRKLATGEAGYSFEVFLSHVGEIAAEQIWRHDQAGDLPGRGNEIDTDKLGQLVAANNGKRGFTYTHKPVLVGEHAEANRNAVAHANLNGFTINLSGNNPSHADKLSELAIAPVVTVLPLDYQRRTTGKGKNAEWSETLPEYRARIKALGLKTPAGRQIAVCPATYLDDVSCGGGKVDGRMTRPCELCQRQRKSIVGFPVHGMRKNKANVIAAS